jgi:HD superfamily phosphodiesterase
MYNIGKLINELIDYFQNDAKRINHFMKVWAYAKAIGENEEIDDNKQMILETAAIVHDIGIKVSEAKYNSSSGKYQQIEGPAIAREVLEKLRYNENIIDRVCFLVANHHTYINIDDIDYQILVEADFIVNIYEDSMQTEEILNIDKKIFKTKTGHMYIKKMYL